MTWLKTPVFNARMLDHRWFPRNWLRVPFLAPQKTINKSSYLITIILKKKSGDIAQW
jgi:hypothetical protein